MGLPPTRQPHRLVGDGLAAYLPVPRHCVCALIRAELFERIPSPLTVAGDLGKRWSAQRLALDT
jgi:hypothetical protein